MVMRFSFDFACNVISVITEGCVIAIELKVFHFFSCCSPFIRE